MSNPVPIPTVSGSAEERSSSPRSGSYGSSPVAGVSPGTPKVHMETLDELDRSGIPLNSPWTFWFDKSVYGTSAADYTANMKKLYTVHTIQSFWGLFNTIPVVSQINNRCSYHLMRNTRRPMWEDPDNASGGTWKIRIGKEHTENVWKEILLAMIGEQFTGFLHSDDSICGASVSVKSQGDVVQIWNSNASVAAESRVLEKVRQLLPDVEFGVHFYKPHKEHAAFDKDLAKR